MDDISHKVVPLHDRLSGVIYFGRNYNYNKEQPFSVNLEFRDGSIKVNLEEKGETLEKAFNTAFSKLRSMVTMGLGSQAMRPALEAPKTGDDPLPAPPQGRLADDDIPF